MYIEFVLLCRLIAQLALCWLIKCLVFLCNDQIMPFFSCFRCIFLFLVIGTKLVTVKQTKKIFLERY